MFGLGIGEIAIILFIALIFIGPKKLPELAKGLGKGMREFQNAARGLQDHIQSPVNEVKDQIMDQGTSKKPSVAESSKPREDAQEHQTPAQENEESKES